MNALLVTYTVDYSRSAAFIVGACSSPSMAEDVSNESSSKDGTSTDDFSSFRKVEDESVISNEHTSKWRVFTDNGRDYFLKASSFMDPF